MKFSLSNVRTHLLITSALFSGAVFANDAISVHDAYARATPPAAPTSAVFLTLENHTDKEKALVSASTSAAGKVELHDVITDGDVMKMRQIQQITIAPNSQTQLKPGSLHIMLFNLVEPLKEGKSIEVNLTFADGSSTRIEAPIKKVMMGMKKHTH